MTSDKADMANEMTSAARDLTPSVDDPPGRVAKRLSSLWKTTTGTIKIFVHVSYLPLLAFFAARVVSPFAGSMVLYFNTIYTAGLCGYALAERRQRNGAEKSAMVALQISEKCCPVAAAMMLSVLSVVCAVRVLWVFFFGPENALGAIYHISFMAILCLYSGTCFVAGFLLNGALFSGHTLGMLFVDVTILGLIMIFTAAIRFGQAIAAVVPWLIAMALAGLLGYTLAVYHNYKQLHLASSSSHQSHQLR